MLDPQLPVICVPDIKALTGETLEYLPLYPCSELGNRVLFKLTDTSVDLVNINLLIVMADQGKNRIQHKPKLRMIFTRCSPSYESQVLSQTMYFHDCQGYYMIKYISFYKNKYIKKYIFFNFKYKKNTIYFSIQGVPK